MRHVLTISYSRKKTRHRTALFTLKWTTTTTNRRPTRPELNVDLEELEASNPASVWMSRFERFRFINDWLTQFNRKTQWHNICLMKEGNSRISSTIFRWIVSFRLVYPCQDYVNTFQLSHTWHYICLSRFVAADERKTNIAENGQGQTMSREISYSSFGRRLHVF